MPTEYVFIAVGILSASVAILPLWVAIRFARRVSRRVGSHTVVAVLAGQMIGFFWLVITIAVVYVNFKPMLLWYSIPAILLLVMLSIVVSLLMVGRSRR